MFTTLTVACLSMGAEPERDWFELDASTSWCGARCLWLLARANQVPCDFETLQGWFPETAPQGHLSMAQLADAAHRLGFHAAPLRCEEPWLRSPHTPSITLHRYTAPADGSQEAKEYFHFVLLVGVEPDGALKAVDPYQPHRVLTVPHDRFVRTWTGDVLAVATSPESLPPSPPRWPDGVLVATSAVAVALLIGIAWRVLASRKRAAALAVVVLSVVFAGCSRPKETSQSTPSPSAQDTIQFDRHVVKAGSLVEGTDSPELEQTFPFVNRTPGAVQIASIETSCVCTGSEYPKGPIAAGETGVIKLRSRLTAPGPFDLRAVVRFDGGLPSQTLSCQGLYVGKPSANPPVLVFPDLRGGVTAEQDLEVRVPLKLGEGRPAVQHKWSGPAGDVTVSERQPPAEVDGSSGRATAYHLRISVRPTGLRPGEELSGTLTWQVDGRTTPVDVGVSGRVVHPNLSANPPRLVLDQAGATARQSVLVAVAPGQHLRLTPRLDPPVPGGRVGVDPDAGTPHQVRVWVELPPGDKPVRHGTVVLTVTEPVSSEYVIPYTAIAIR